MKVFHTTTRDAEAKIRAGGFRDAVGSYLTGTLWAGVWVADRVLDVNSGPRGDRVFVLEIRRGEIEPYEWVEEGKPYREFLVPAAILNRAELVGIYDLFGDELDEVEEQAQPRRESRRNALRLLPVSESRPERRRES